MRHPIWCPLSVGMMLFIVVAMAEGQSVPHPNILDPTETLRGQPTISVFIVLDGIDEVREAFLSTGDRSELSATTLRAKIEAQLKKAGINVRPVGPPTYPALQLRLSGAVARGYRVQSSAIYSIELEYVQLLPVRSGDAGSPLAEARTWHSGGFGLLPPGTIVSELNSQVEGRTNLFINTYMKANLTAMVKQSGGPAGSRPLYSEKVRDMTQGDFGVQGYPRQLQDALLSQLNNLQSKKQQVVDCAYGPDDPKLKRGFTVYKFWYKNPPADLRHLLDSMPSGGRHPLEYMGFGAVDACPASSDVATKIERAGMVR